MILVGVGAMMKGEIQAWIKRHLCTLKQKAVGMRSAAAGGETKGHKNDRCCRHSLA